jgi:hypothetical protein
MPRGHYVGTKSLRDEGHLNFLRVARGCAAGVERS